LRWPNEDGSTKYHGGSMKKNFLFIALAVFGLAGVWVVRGEATEGVELCHWDNGQNAWEAIIVGEKAADAHLTQHENDFLIDVENPCPPID
jgi:hypothetical protein